jgi:hypothetical protein
MAQLHSQLARASSPKLFNAETVFVASFPPFVFGEHRWVLPRSRWRFSFSDRPVASIVGRQLFERIDGTAYFPACGVRRYHHLGF